MSRLAPSRRAVLAGLATLPALTARATDTVAPFRKGVSIHNRLNWGKVEAEGSSRYRWPPFETPAHVLKPELVSGIKAAGFDFVRLTIDPGVFLFFTGNQRDDLDALLMVEVKRLLAAGLGVVVDFHPNSQVAAYAPEKITASADGPLARAYGEMLVRTARLLTPLKGQRIALEMMNEPQWGWDGPTAQRWAAIQKGWHDQVRKVAPELTLILTGARGGNLDGLIALDPAPYRGSDVLWSLHYYEPFLLTHQGVKADQGEAKVWRWFSDLPYPAAPEMVEPIWFLIRKRIEADTALPAGERAAALRDSEKALKAYLDGKWGRARIAADFKRVEDWARQHRIEQTRIFLGEFGITRSYGPYRASPPGPLENWLTDVRSEAEARGFGWALWALSGYGGMSLIETDEATRFDQPTLNGLGLTPR